MKKVLQKIVMTLCITLLLALVGYLALVQYYHKKIPYGTWVNDVYCTGKNYDEAAKLLFETNEYIPELVVVDVEGNSHKLVLPEGSYALSYRENLERAIIRENVFIEKHLEVMPTVLVDNEKFEQYVLSQPVLAQKKVLSGTRRMEIIKKEDGFHLVDQFEHVLDINKAKKAIYDAIISGEKTVNLAKADCYYTPSYTKEDEQIKTQYIKLLEFCYTFTMEITINGDVAYTVDASVLKDWLLTNKDGTYATTKDGSYQLDKTKVKEYANQIAEETTTYFGKPWEFANHNGVTVEVKAGNYGRKLKTNELYKSLISCFEQGDQGKFAYELEFSFYPKMAQDNGYGASIGDSYAEVDLSEQRIYLYIDGECVLESDCVTGDVRRNRETPDGVFYVEYKQRNRVLKGEDYRTPVNYWMHFYNHCGFHDAVWRKSFGDDIYLNDGSHGCINMPFEKAKEMYELVYKGMPVVIY